MAALPTIAIVAGSGALPELLADICRAKGQRCVVVAFDGVFLDWSGNHTVIAARFEKLGAMFDALQKAGVSAAVFAGAMRRPTLDLTDLDETSTGLLAALAAGDDTTLRAAARLFEDAGITVLAPHDLAPMLLAGSGPLGRHRPAPADTADIMRATEIVAALGLVDIGQAAVVVQGLCLGLESLQGTDAMLGFVADTVQGLRPDPNGAKGVLFKAAKPGQDRRLDLPAIGPDTIDAAHRAGLAGVAVQTGGVMILDMAETIRRADHLGLFLTGVEGRS